MDPTSKTVKRNMLIAAIVYIVGTLGLGAYIATEAYSCVGEDFEQGVECLEEVDSNSAVFQALFALLQVAGVGTAVYLLIQHQNKRREMYGHNTVQNAQLDQHMQQQQAAQPPVQGQDEPKEQK